MTSAADVEAEVEASRDQLDRNIEALKQKMTPREVLGEASRAMGSTGQQVASRLVDEAKANPLPFAVMGLGLAWLIVSNSKQSRSYAYGSSSYASPEPRTFAPGEEYGAPWEGSATGYEDAGYEDASLAGTTGAAYGDDTTGASRGGRIKEKMHNMSDKASNAVSGVKQKLAGGVSSARDGGHAAAHRVGSAAENVRDRASMAGQQVRQRASMAGHQVQRTFVDTLESEPLLIAGLGLVVGAAIGAALPSTPAEDRLLGEHRDKLLDRGKDIAQQGIRQASTVAQSAYGAAKTEMQGGREEGADPTERVGDALQAGIDSARDEFQNGASH